MKKKIILCFVGIVVVIGLVSIGAYLYNSNNISNKSGQTQTKPIAKSVTYSGKDGVTALDLLKKNAKIVTSGSGENTFVTTINGYKASDSKKEYWSFSVDGKAASIGAGSYITKDNEAITWKIAISTF